MAIVGALGIVTGDATRAAAPLRAVDWRFLLPTPPGEPFRRLVVLGGPAGIMERAVRAALAHEVLTTLPRASSVDAVAAYADATETIPEIAGALSDGAVLYLEIDRTHRGVSASTPRRVEAVLRDFGISACAFYALEPNAHEPRAFVPLDAPRAMSWHRRASFGDRPSMRIASVVRQAAVRMGGATVAALDRPYAVVGVRGDRVDATPGTLRHPEVLRRLGIARHPPATVMLTYGGDRVLLFPFAENGHEPAGVVKVPKTEALIDRTENEQTRMQTLRAALQPSLAATIPEPLGTVPMPGTIAACERVVPGTSIAARAMDPKQSLDDKIADLELAMAWLSRFQRATTVRRATVRESYEALVAGPVEWYEREIGAAEEGALFSALRSRVLALGDSAIAISTEHRDFAAWNVLRAGHQLGVVDWEGAREGFAPFDAVHFVTTWLYSVRLADGVDDETRCVLDLLDPTHRLDRAAAAARDALGWSLHALDVDERLAPLIIALHRVELAVRRAIQLRLQSAADSAESTIEIRIVRVLAQRADLLLSARNS